MPSSPICSVSSRRGQLMNEAIQQIVERVWVNQIGVPPEWSDQDC